MYLLEKLFTIPTINPVQKYVYDILSDIVTKDGVINQKLVSKWSKVDYSKEVVLKTIHSSKLKRLSNDLYIANKEKPIKIYIVLSTKGNSYFPTKRELRISIPLQAIYALNTFIQNGCYNIFDTKNYHFKNSKQWFRGITQFKDFINEYENSIVHELTHWVDDAFHNSFFTKLKIFADQIEMTAEEFSKVYNNSPVDTMFFEINAQVHIIEKLRQKNIKDWDTFTLSDIIMSHSGLQAVFHLVQSSDYLLLYKWNKALIKRMSRENILPKNIKPLADYDIQNMTKFLSIREGVLIN